MVHNATLFFHPSALPLNTEAPLLLNLKSFQIGGLNPCKKLILPRQDNQKCKTLILLLPDLC